LFKEVREEYQSLQRAARESEREMGERPKTVLREDTCEEQGIGNTSLADTLVILCTLPRSRTDEYPTSLDRDIGAKV
jgi:hypothetical protein